MKKSGRTPWPILTGCPTGSVKRPNGSSEPQGSWNMNIRASLALAVVPLLLLLPANARQAALERIEWHTSQGDDVVVVSASLDVYLGPWCEGRGLDYVCTTLEERLGRLTGRCAEGDCSGAEKVRRIR